MENKIVVKISLFLMILVALPAILFAYSALEQYSDYKKPLVQDGGSYYRICNVSICKSFEKKLINSPDSNSDTSSFISQMEKLDRANYYNMLEVARGISERHKQSFYFYGLIFIGYLIIPITFWIINKIILDKDRLIIRSYFAIRSARAQTSRKKDININNIESIQVVTTTPLGPSRNNIEQINWRERIEIEYRLENNLKDQAVVELWLFPGFKRILKEIIKKRPDLQITFRKRGIIENLSEV